MALLARSRQRRRIYNPFVEGEYDDDDYDSKKLG